jgi:hypothetical protein
MLAGQDARSFQIVRHWHLSRPCGISCRISRFFHLRELATVNAVNKIGESNQSEADNDVRPFGLFRNWRMVSAWFFVLLYLLSGGFTLYAVNERLSTGWRLWQRLFAALIGGGLAFFFLIHAADLFGL